MISGDRRAERPPYCAREPVRDLSNVQYLYSAFRQALLEYLTRLPRGAVLMPEYVPQGVHDPYLRAGWEIAFYPLGLSLALDRGALETAIAARRPDHLVCIHHFGVYLEDNLRLARDILPEGGVLLEDFAHTLPQADVPVTGDLAAYSFTKTLGVAEGGLLWFRDRARLLPCRAGEDGERARTLRKRLECHLAMESFCARWDLPRVAESAARRVLARGTEYYDFLQEQYPAIHAPIGAVSRAILERVDLERVATRRREIARIYLEGLDPRLLLPVPPASLTRQALYAFPVQVDDRRAFLAHLRHRGVRASTLVEHWWFLPENPRHELLARHVLLPAGHHLSDAKIRRVISAANAFFAAA